MDSTFTYNKFVTGKYFVGRKNDATILANMLSQGENVSIYDAPKSGKTSLIQQTFYNMKVATQRFSVVEFSLLNIRTAADLCIKLGTTLLKSAFTTPEEFAAAVPKLLEGTHFIFDPEVFSNSGMVLALNWDIDDSDIRAIFSLPYGIAKEKGQKMYVVLDDFSNVMMTEDGDKICKIINGLISGLDEDWRRKCGFLFVGSQTNAMKDIFEVRKLFYRNVEHVSLSQIEDKDIIDHFLRGFLSGGKVVDRNLALGMCQLFKNNIWYINHFAAICDSLSKGYMSEPIFEEALATIIAIHEPRFISSMNDLTTFQICLLRAILDGHTKFSSAEVIQKYNLNSSANVRRLKDALSKKEIVTFDQEERPMILDPLFEYWVRHYFFCIGQ